VYGTARVKGLYIDETNVWADYVFAPSYRLRPLSEVAAFIEENQHLPEVPSAEEVAETGYDQVALNATLLQKIEELTLYVIELKEENETLNARLSEVEARD
ncbi:MAG TPA: hypothetical protein DCE41_36735, partial [Cytophagales bacterium]|nr:hypothetical protein [Cytophagales bacterium]